MGKRNCDEYITMSKARQMYDKRRAYMIDHGERDLAGDLDNDGICSIFEWLFHAAEWVFKYDPGDIVLHEGRYCVVKNHTTESDNHGNGSIALFHRYLQIQLPGGVIKTVSEEKVSKAEIPPDLMEIAREKVIGEMKQDEIVRKAFGKCQ